MMAAFGYNKVNKETQSRWNASKENKRKMVEKLENLVRKSCLERTGKEPIGRSMVVTVKIWKNGQKDA